MKQVNNTPENGNYQRDVLVNFPVAGVIGIKHDVPEKNPFEKNVYAGLKKAFAYTVVNSVPFILNLIN